MIDETLYQSGTKPSTIFQLFEYGLKQAAVVGRENVYDYSLGNPSVPAPQQVTDAFQRLLGQEDPVSLHGYTPAAGALDVRQSIAADLSARSGMDIRPQNLFLTCGAAPALLYVLRALAVAQAEVIAITPYFPEYRVYAEACGMRFVPTQADLDQFQINLTSLEDCITPHTQAVIVNSPNKPAGAVYSRETLEKLAALLTAKAGEYGHPIYVIADEPYRELVYDGADVPFIPGIYPDTVVCYSYSKSLSLPGERLGYFCVPDGAADSPRLYTAACAAARMMGHVCAPALQQRVISACTGIRPQLEVYDRNRRTLYDALTSYGYRCVYPSGAFYLFVEAPGGSARAFSGRAKEHNLLVVPGDDFGCPAFFRLSTCVDSDMVERSLPVFQRLAE